MVIASPPPPPAAAAAAAGLEQGFTTGQACTNGLGSCSAGLDLTACDSKLEYECGTAGKAAGMLLSDCGELLAG